MRPADGLLIHYPRPCRPFSLSKHISLYQGQSTGPFPWGPWGHQSTPNGKFSTRCAFGGALLKNTPWQLLPVCVCTPAFSVYTRSRRGDNNSMLVSWSSPELAAQAEDCRCHMCLDQSAANVLISQKEKGKHWADRRPSVPTKGHFSDGQGFFLPFFGGGGVRLLPLPLLFHLEPLIAFHLNQLTQFSKPSPPILFYPYDQPCARERS